MNECPWHTSPFSVGGETYEVLRCTHVGPYFVAELFDIGDGSITVEYAITIADGVDRRGNTYSHCWHCLKSKSWPHCEDPDIPATYDAFVRRL